MLFGERLIREPVMTPQTQETLHTVSRAVGVLLITLLVGVGGTLLYHNRNAAIDLLPQSWLSDEDREVLKDAKAANQAAYDKMSREAWERTQSQQPQNGWDLGRRK
jgi:hypothetical protein